MCCIMNFMLMLTMFFFVTNLPYSIMSIMLMLTMFIFRDCSSILYFEQYVDADYCSLLRLI